MISATTKTTTTFSHDLAVAAGSLAKIVTRFEDSRNPGGDTRRAEARNLMASIMSFARLMKIRIDPNVASAFEDVLNGRPIIAARFQGRGESGQIITRYFDAFDLQYRWHEFPADTDFTRPILAFPERPSTVSPLNRGVYLRVDPSQLIPIPASQDQRVVA